MQEVEVREADWLWVTQRLQTSACDFELELKEGMIMKLR